MHLFDAEVGGRTLLLGKNVKLRTISQESAKKTYIFPGAKVKSI
jgi:hypothetical protein